MGEKADQEKTKNQETAVKSEKTSACAVTLAVVGIILASVGLIFGIYSTVQSNKALNILDENEITVEEDEEGNSGAGGSSDDVATDEEEDEEEYVKPTSADKIEYIGVVYEDGTKAIDVYREDMEAIYYVANDDAEDGWDMETKEIDEKIFSYVFDNDLQYLDEYKELENESWYLEVGTEDGGSYANGEGEMPDWFKALLKELGV